MINPKTRVDIWHYYKDRMRVHVEDWKKVKMLLELPKSEIGNWYDNGGINYGWDIELPMSQKTYVENKFKQKMSKE